MTDSPIQEGGEAFSLSDYQIEQDAMARLLPAWFVPRMMGDSWFFGLRLITGEMLGIETINSVIRATDGSIWLDVRLMSDQPFSMMVTVAPTSRLEASVNAAHVMYAVELADT